MNRERFINIVSAGSVDVHEYARLLLVKQAAKAAQPFSVFDVNGDHTPGFFEYMTLVPKLAPARAAH
jgi:hypothetical protein